MCKLIRYLNNFIYITKLYIIIIILKFATETKRVMNELMNSVNNKLIKFWNENEILRITINVMLKIIHIFKYFLSVILIQKFYKNFI